MLLYLFAGMVRHGITHLANPVIQVDDIHPVGFDVVISHFT